MQKADYKVSPLILIRLDNAFGQTLNLLTA